HVCFRREEVCSPRNKIIFPDLELVFGRNEFVLPGPCLFSARRSLFSEKQNYIPRSRTRFWQERVRPPRAMFVFGEKKFVLRETKLYSPISNSFLAGTSSSSQGHVCFRREEVCFPRNKIIFPDLELVFGRNKFVFGERRLVFVETK